MPILKKCNFTLYMKYVTLFSRKYLVTLVSACSLGFKEVGLSEMEEIHPRCAKTHLCYFTTHSFNSSDSKEITPSS